MISKINPKIGKHIKQRAIEKLKESLPESMKQTIRYGRDRIYKPVIYSVKIKIGKIKNHDKPKVFGIGNNKTGNERVGI